MVGNNFKRQAFFARKRYWEIRAKNKRIRSIESISKKLRSENRSNEEFEILLNNLTLEELIQLKLEVSTQRVTFNKFYNFPLWKTIPSIVREAVLKFALTSSMSRKESAAVLGISVDSLKDIVKKMKPFDGDETESIG